MHVHTMMNCFTRDMLSSQEANRISLVSLSRGNTPSSVQSNDLKPLHSRYIQWTGTKQCIDKTHWCWHLTIHTGIDPKSSAWFRPPISSLGLHFELPKRSWHILTQCSASGHCYIQIDSQWANTDMLWWHCRKDTKSHECVHTVLQKETRVVWAAYWIYWYADKLTVKANSLLMLTWPHSMHITFSWFFHQYLSK